MKCTEIDNLHAYNAVNQKLELENRKTNETENIWISHEQETVNENSKNR